MYFKCQTFVGVVVVMMVCLMLSGWRFGQVFSDEMKSAEQCLNTCFDAEASKVKLKKWDLKITENGFFRFRKYLPNGKQEYFSFNLNRFSSFDYLGTNESGTLTLRTSANDIIVQTYNDPRGNIDSMSNELALPLKNIEAEQLNALYVSLSSRKKF
jgi:hypothetical protein